MLDICYILTDFHNPNTTLRLYHSVVSLTVNPCLNNIYQYIMSVIQRIQVKDAVVFMKSAFVSQTVSTHTNEVKKERQSVL